MASLGERLGLVSAAEAEKRENAETLELWARRNPTLFVCLSVPEPSAVELALRRAGLPVCGSRARLVAHRHLSYSICSGDDVLARSWRRLHGRCSPRRRCGWWLPLGGGRGLVRCATAGGAR